MGQPDAMPPMNSHQIRETFLDFFCGKLHTIVPSAPIVLKNDPTLMFTNAGMNQFKDYFLGNQQPETVRVADTQRCLRVSGKHNDLEDVGHDTYHHTMFEMLGNWSFGDYFKKDAIAWAWELLTDVFGLPIEDLYVTVFEGDVKEGLAPDDEARSFWSALVPAERILNGNKKDNFWEMGETGPCGPCSEIHIDLRPAHLRDVPGRDLVNDSHPQVVEIWNLVFMQFNRLADGSLQKLPAQHVDTGMGFERLCMAIQKKTSNYDTDVFQPVIQKLCADCGLRYGEVLKTDIALRVIADHIRAVFFIIADGQLPSNNKAGYVLRRILRRAVRYGYTELNRREPFMHDLVPMIARQFSHVFPEAAKQEGFVKTIVFEEETSFLRTLGSGLTRLDDALKALANTGGSTLAGNLAFELYDTFGFPLDLTALIAGEQGYRLDEAGFVAAMAQQKQRSRSDAQVQRGDWVSVNDDAEQVMFVGYDTLSTQTTILRYRIVQQKGKDIYQVVFSPTPFYGESGGQVGDTGSIHNDVERIRVVNTVKENNLIISILEQLPQELTGTWTASVDEERRTRTSANHSATHLMHASLRNLLGTHVEQKGSLVHPEHLRFDFSHFTKMTADDLRAIESDVNMHIRRNIALNDEREVPIAVAQERGAMALFGEKYGKTVRVVTFDPNFSVELCGGTHVQATGQIGVFKIVSESSVASGVRRIEALTGQAALDYLSSYQQEVDQLRETLGATKTLTAAVEKMNAELTKLRADAQAVAKRESKALQESLKTKTTAQNGLVVTMEVVADAQADHIRQVAQSIKNEGSSQAVLLLAKSDGKLQMAVGISPNLAKGNVLHAGNIVKQLAPLMAGSGGGQAEFASAAGTNVQAIEKIKTAFSQLLAAIGTPANG